MEYSLQDQLMDEDVPPLPIINGLPSPGQAILQDTNSWDESVHNLRFGISPRNTPEQIMTYQGPAHHKLEPDVVMTQRYQRYVHERRREEYVKQKLEERKAEFEEERRRQAEQAEQAAAAERANILERSRQKAMSAQQQLQQEQANFIARHPEFRSLASQASRPRGLGLSFPSPNGAQYSLPGQAVPTGRSQTPLRATASSATSTVIDSQARQHWLSRLFDEDDASTTRDISSEKRSPGRRMQHLDDTITSSPTYHASPALSRNNTIPYGQNANTAATQPARGSSRSLDKTQDQFSHSLPLHGNDDTFRSLRNDQSKFPFPLPTGTLGLPQHQTQCATAGPTYTPTPSTGSPNLRKDTIIVPRDTYLLSASTFSMNDNEPAPPISATNNDEASPEPSLSETIGSETPSSSDNNDDDDGDSDFDPRSKPAPPPGYRDIKGFGMRTRRSSGRGRRR